MGLARGAHTAGSSNFRTWLFLGHKMPISRLFPYAQSPVCNHWVKQQGVSLLSQMLFETLSKASVGRVRVKLLPLFPPFLFLGRRND